MIATAGFEVVEHTADWALCVWGADLAGLFCQAAWGLNSLLYSGTAQIPLSKTRKISLESDDAESLLVMWLEELAFWAETESMLFSRLHLLEITHSKLQANVTGGQVFPLEKHIKAVTYHDLHIVKIEGRWQTTIVFDV